MIFHVHILDDNKGKEKQAALTSEVHAASMTAALAEMCWRPL